MRKRIVLISVVFALCAPVIIYAEDAAMQGTVMVPTASNVVSQEPALDSGSPTYSVPPKTQEESPPVSFAREWYIIAKHPNSKHLVIGVFWLQEGMPIEHIRSILGNPQHNVTPDIEGYGTILVYPQHYLFFSATGHLKTVKER